MNENKINMNISINLTGEVQVTLAPLFPASNPIVTDDVRKVVDSVQNSLIFVFGTLGVVTNAINIRVFIQQGLSSDSSTIGLFSLAIADFLGCILLIPSPICDLLKYTSNGPIVFSCSSWFHLLFTIPHIAMSRLTCWITVYIAVERSLCVLMPFEIRRLIRPKVTICSMIFLYFSSFCIYFAMYVNTGIRYGHHSDFNATVALYTETAMAKVIRNYMSLIFNTIMSTVAVFIVAIATALMLYKLNQMKKWRENSTHKTGSVKVPAVNDNSDDKPSDKEKTGQGKKDVEVLKMVVMVTGLFLVCLSMSQLPGIASAFVPGFSVTGANKNIFLILYFFKFVFDVINSSLNFFFYIRISSKYKLAFDQVFFETK